MHTNSAAITEILGRCATPPTRQILVNGCSITGCRHWDDAAALPTLTTGARLVLRPEPDNPHDGFAVEIHHDPTKLGSAPRFWNRHVSRLLRDGIPLACELDQVEPDSSPWDDVSVRVSLPTTTPPMA